jgi:hypothetical protein
MAGDYTNKIFGATLVIPNAFTTGNGQAAWIAPCDCKLVYAAAGIETLGGTGETTSIMLRNDTDTVDLLASTIEIAYNADPAVAAGTLTTTAAYLLIDSGDVIEVDVDGVCTGAAEAGLTVYLYLQGM